MAILAESHDVTMVLVLQMANFSVKSIYKRYKINSLNKVYTRFHNNGACASKKYLVEYFKFRINISNFELDLYQISERDRPLYCQADALAVC